MSILLEVISCALSAGTGYGLPILFKKLKKNYDDGSVPWLLKTINTGSYERITGFSCPKCNQLSLNNMMIPFCEDPHFPRGHYDFTCNHCNFSCIMRSVDDKGDR